MIDIVVSDEFRDVCPDFRGAALFAGVGNSMSDGVLWERIDEFCDAFVSEKGMNDIKANGVIGATRLAYKRFGKDPNRYRPSAEALCRRVVRGLGLYRVNTLVDIINLVSMGTGYSIGGFDVDRIVGDRLVLGVGRENEPFDAIGRGVLNIEGLPVYRDGLGGIGTPTSDNERTKLGLDTVSLLVVLNGYDGGKGLQEGLDWLVSLLSDFGGLEDFDVVWF